MTQQRTQETRVALLSAARDVFRDQSYHGSSVQDVALRANRGQGTFYLHFPNKSAILAALCSESVKRLEHLVEAVYRREPPPQEPISSAIGDILTAYGRDSDLWDLLTQAAASDPEVAQLEKRRQCVLVELFTAALEAQCPQGVPGIGNRILARLISAMTEDIGQVMREQGWWRHDEAVKHLTRVWTRVLDEQHVAGDLAGALGEETSPSDRSPGDIPRGPGFAADADLADSEGDVGLTARGSGGGTRARMENAARALFRRQGYAKTTVADIVREAGCSRGAFYLHFRSTEDVFADLIALMGQEIVAHARSRWLQSSREEAIRLGILDFLLQVEANGDLWRLLEQMAAVNETGRLNRSGIRQLFADRIERGILAGGGTADPEVDAFVGAQLLTSMVFRFARLGQLPEDPEVLARHMSRVWRSVLRMG